jgi:hypothetical protein
MISKGSWRGAVHWVLDGPKVTRGCTWLLLGYGLAKAIGGLVEWIREPLLWVCIFLLISGTVTLLIALAKFLRDVIAGYEDLLHWRRSGLSRERWGAAWDARERHNSGLRVGGLSEEQILGYWTSFEASPEGVQNRP